MNEPSLQEKIINVIVLLQAAMRNLRMYPPTSAIILKSMEKALEAFNEIIRTPI